MPADDAVRERFMRDGFAVLPRYLGADELEDAIGGLGEEFPTAEEFHDDVEPQRTERFRDEFGGITNFPFASTALSLVAVHGRLIDLAASLLSTEDLRVYSIEAWAKYTGAAGYDQPLHRDYLNHSLLVPDPDRPPQQVEMFLYLCDVPVDLGPPSYVPVELTADLPALPNWYPREDGVADENNPRWVSEHGRPDLYERERPAAGPVGTVVAYRIETFHRGTALRAPGGARYTIHTNFRRADADWIGRRSWVSSANTRQWRAFVENATTRQLELFGFPRPGHPYWTERTATGLQQRYPGLAVHRWMNP